MNKTPEKQSKNDDWAIRKGGLGIACFSDGDVEPVRFHDRPHLLFTASKIEHVDQADIPADAIVLGNATVIAKAMPDGRFELIHFDHPPMSFVRCDFLRKREDEDGAREDLSTHMIQPPPMAAEPSCDHPVTPGTGARK